MKEEAAWQAKYIKYVENKLGGIAVKLIKTNKLGWPDLLILIPAGHKTFTLHVECKSKNGRLAPVQKSMKNFLENLGVDVYTFYGFNEAVKETLKIIHVEKNETPKYRMV